MVDRLRAPDPFAAAANPYGFGTSSTAGGTGIMDVAQSAISAIPSLVPQQPQQQAPAANVWWNANTREFFVNGLTVSENDDAKILESAELLNRPSVGGPQGGGWVPVMPESFAQVVEAIRSPTRGRLFRRGFEVGTQQLKQLGGSALQLAGAEEFGGRLVESAEERIEQLSPYQREFTDVEFGSADKGLIDWFVATLGTQGPMVLESVAAGLAGAAVGSTTAGPVVGTAGGFLAGVFGRKAFRDSVLKAAQRYRAGNATPADLKVLRNASAITGAVAGAYGSSYVIGAGDIYEEMREQGVTAEDFGARMTALAGAFPYALAETIPEFFIAGRVLGVGGRAALPRGAGALRRGAEYGVIRPATGAAVFGAAEGLTEIAQESIVLSLSGQSLTDDEAVNRFINAFAAGAAVGGTLGGVANLRSRRPDGTPTAESKDPVNLLDSSGTRTQTRGIQPRTEPGQPLAERGFVGDVLPGEFGPQGVLDLGGMTVGEARLRSRTPTGAPLQIEGPPQAAPQAAPGQLALQFAPPAPEGIGFTDQQPVPNTLMAQQMQAAQRQQEVALAEQQRQQQVTAEREQQINLMQAQQQLQIAEQARRAEQRAALPPAQAPLQLPTVPIVPRQPQQLPLFTPQEAPRPSRAEGLRRGVGTQPEPLAPVQPEPVGRQPRQLPLITQAGQPSVAALRAAGQRGPLPIPTLEPGATQIPPTGSPVTAATIAAARQRLALRRAVGRVEYDNGDVYEGQLKNGEPNGEGIYFFSDGDVVTGTFRNGQIATGTYTYEDGSTYVGQFSDGQFEGQGVFTDVNGTVLEGTFENGRFVPPTEPPPAPRGETLRRGRRAAPRRAAPAAAAETGRPVLEAPTFIGENEPTTDAEVRERDAAIETYQELLRLGPTQNYYNLVASGVFVPDWRPIFTKYNVQIYGNPGDLVTLDTWNPSAHGAVAEVAGVIRTGSEPVVVQRPALVVVRENGSLRILDKGLTTTLDRFTPTFDPTPPAPRAETLRRGRRRDAVQEPSAAPVPTRRRARTRQEVGAQVPAQEQVTPEGQVQAQAAQAQVTPLEEPFTPKTMAELEAEAAAQRPLRTERAPEPTASELVDGAIAIAESTVDPDEFVDAASNLMFHAYVDTETNNKAANDKARNFIENTEFDAVQRQALNDALVDEINIKGRIEVHRVEKGEGKFKPVHKYLLDNNLYPRLDATIGGIRAEDAAQLVSDGVVSLTNLTDKTAKDVISINPDLVADDANNLARGKKDDTRENPATRLAAAIRAINTSQTALNESTRQQRIADIQAQWEALPEEFRDFIDETGTPLSDYFTDDIPNVTIINRKLRVTKQIYTDEQVAAFEADEAVEVDPDVRALEAEERGERIVFDWRAKIEDGRFSRDDGTPIAAPLAVGRIRMGVTKFLNRLAVKPRVYIYKDQADLKAKNPRLHQRAADSRAQGDFDSVQAAGFSFGDGNVIIFSDYIATDQQLNFVLAHETLGHFGLRGIIPAQKFDALMERIYQENPGIQGDVDAAMMARDMPRAEAVEEYLSDFAAQLDTSIMARVWNAIKDALNRLGVQFGDESARYFVSQSRRYVRDGGAGVPFEIASVINRLYDVEYGVAPVSTGRFATQGNVFEDVRAADMLKDKIGGLPMNFQEGWNWLKGEGVNNLSSYDKVKAKFLSLANFRARQNPGAQAMENLIDEMRNRSMSIKVEMNEKLREVLNKAVFNNVWGISKEQVETLSDVMYNAQRYAVNQFDRTAERTREPLYRFVDGELVPNQPEIDRLANAGRITFEQMRDGFEYEVQALVDGKFVTETERFAGIPNLTEDSIEWRGYNQLRDAMNDVELRLLRARYMSAIAEQDIAFNEIGELMVNKELTSADQTMIRRALAKYKELYTDGLTLDDRGYVTLDAEAMSRGNDFLVALNQAILGERTDLTDKLVAEYFTGKVASDFATQLNDFKTRLRLPDDNRFIIQNRVKQLVLSEMSNSDADLYTRRSIATGYTPVLREGAYQIRVEATDPQTGRRLQLKESSRDQLIYSQFDTPKQSMEAARQINSVFDGKSYKLEVYDENAGTYIMRDVKLEAVSEAALDAVAAPPELNLNEFVRGLRQFDIALTPQKMETVVTALTRQNNAARNRLERAFVRGYDRDGITAISRHIESRASTIAKTQLRPRMAELMNLRLAKTQRLWNGDRDVLQKLKENSERVAADPNATPEQKVLAQREYDRYRYMYETTNPKGQPRKGMQYYNEAARTAAFLDGNRNVDESDFGSGKLVSATRALTSMMQLGGSIATGLLNIIGAYTNGLPYLASYNEKNGFGGGFGIGPAVAEFHIAAKDVGVIGMNPFSETSRAANRAEFYDRIAASPELQAQYNLKDHEARFIAREIREGTMIPAQSNALVGTARGRTTLGFNQKLIDGWMLTFNLTEQSSRRSLGLAAYRLEHKRQISAGATQAQAEAAARKMAVSAMQLTLGEYSVLNRPPAWRSGIQSFMYMYKVFPTTSVQLMANLSRNGRLGMIAGLMILSGLSGLPFAEDLEDIIDTLAQKLGFKVGSVRFEAAKFIDSMFPGMSPIVLTGFANANLPGNLSSRTSLGNLFPGTGMFLSGANTSREMMDIAGPAASAFTGTVKTLSDIARLPFSDQLTANAVLRESPITIARAFADAYAYSQAGSVIDRRGYIITRDMHAGTIAARMMGFYPTAAADQYNAIRVAKRMTDYQRDTSTAFRTAWINAMQTGDRQRARNIEQAVVEWNRGARGTALEIRNFQSNARRALREAQRPAGERTLRSAPRAARQDIERLADLLGY